MVSQVVSAEWLKKELDAGNPDIRVLDVTWYSDRDAKEDYLKAHIPGAVYFNIFEGAQHTELYARNLPSEEAFQANARAAGVSDTSHVILYDNTGQGGFFVGSRAWWTFSMFSHEKTSVLDGGMALWKEKGYPTTAEPTEVKPGNFTAKYCSGLKVTEDLMKDNLTKREFQVVDTRPLAVYQGNKDDPKSGHYPGAVNMHMASTFLDKDKKQLKSPEELKEVFSAAGIEVEKPLASMCFSGMSSCTAILAATLLGNRCSAVYHGGFTEWRHMHPEHIEQTPPK